MHFQQVNLLISMNLHKITLFSLLIIGLGACRVPRLTQATNAAITYHGRTLTNGGNEVDLISAASYAELQFSGKSCTFSLINHAEKNDYNYVAIELDGEYKGRFKVSDTIATPLTIKVNNRNKWHQMRIFKATEAQNGIVTVKGVSAARIRNVPIAPKKRIEFMGNSITSGMGNDLKEIPCGNGSKWYDQHNAYWSYATRVAQELNVDFMLSSISGAGIYRNWNSDGPTVPQQYKNTYLRLDSLQQWDFTRYTPDIVSIALGTNDLSLGDGQTPRLPFDSTAFVNTYIDFIKTVYTHYPNTQIVLLNSPMVDGNKGQILTGCLKIIQAAVMAQMPEKKPIKVFEFKAVPATGCTGHPTKEEHAMMAQQLLPFMQQVLAELN